MKSIRLEVRRRTLLLDERDYVFITEDGVEIEKTTTEGVVSRVERFVRRRLRGAARVHGRAQILQSLRQFNSPKEGYVQFVTVEGTAAERLVGLDGPVRQSVLDDVVVRAVQARRPVELQAMERWVRERALWIGLSGKSQVLSGKVRLATEGIVSDFKAEKLVARSLLDKVEAFRGPTLRLLVVDDPFLDAVCGDGAFLLRASAPRDCERTVSQRVRRCLDYKAMDAKRGEVYLRLEFEDKVARYDTEIVRVAEDGDLLHLDKRERARIDTGAKLCHEAGFKATAIVVDRLPEHIEREWPGLDGVCNASVIKSNALLAAHSQQAMWGWFQRAFLLHLPVRMLFTGEERFSMRGNRVSMNVLSTAHTVSPSILDRIIESRVDEGPGPIINALLWWGDHLAQEAERPDGAWGLPERWKAELRESWAEGFERRFAFGDMPDHPMLDPHANPHGFVARGRGGNWLVVPSARALLATLGKVEVEGEHGFHFPDALNSTLQAIRSLDIAPERFRASREQLRENVVRAANAMLDAHSIRVPGLHGVLVTVKGLGERVIVPNHCAPFVGTIHGEPCMNRDGVRQARVEPLGFARDRGAEGPEAQYLLDHLVGADYSVVMADFDRLTRMGRDGDGDLVYVSRIRAAEEQLRAMDAEAERVARFIDPDARFGRISAAFKELQADHDPYELSAEEVHNAVVETASAARDVGSITMFKYVAQEALAEAEAWDLMAVVARIAQAYIDGMKGKHQQSANLFAALVRVWARMAVPCLAVKEDGVTTAVRLTETLRRELVRAHYVEGRDFHAYVDIPHPALADEGYRKIKAPLVAILEEILAGIEAQGLARRCELVRLRDVLEHAYGAYPTVAAEDRESKVAERKATYTAVRMLYGVTPVRGLADVERVGIRPLWKRLISLSTDPGEGRTALDRLAEQALAYSVRPERVEL